MKKASAYAKPTIETPPPPPMKKKKKECEVLKYTRHERDSSRRYADQLEEQRDEARAAYEAETKSTMEMAAKITQLEAECHRSQCERDHWKQVALKEQRRAAALAVELESQREAAGTADEKPDGQAENS